MMTTIAEASKLIDTIMRAEGYVAASGLVGDQLREYGFDLPDDGVELALRSAGYRPVHCQSAVWVPVTEEDRPDGEISRLHHEVAEMRNVLQAGVIWADQAAELLEALGGNAEPIAAGLRDFSNAAVGVHDEDD